MAEGRRKGFLKGSHWSLTDLVEKAGPVRTLSSGFGAFHRGVAAIAASGAISFTAGFDFSHPVPLVGAGLTAGVGAWTALKEGTHFASTWNAPLWMRGNEGKYTASREAATLGMRNAGDDAVEYNAGAQDKLDGLDRPGEDRPAAREGWERAQLEQVQRGRKGLTIFAATCRQQMDIQDAERVNDSGEAADATQRQADSLIAAANAPPSDAEGGPVAESEMTASEDVAEADTAGAQGESSKEPDPDGDDASAAGSGAAEDPLDDTDGEEDSGSDVAHEDPDTSDGPDRVEAAEPEPEPEPEEVEREAAAEEQDSEEQVPEPSEAEAEEDDPGLAVEPAAEDGASDDTEAATSAATDAEGEADVGPEVATGGETDNSDAAPEADVEAAAAGPHEASAEAAAVPEEPEHEDDADADLDW